MNSLVHVLHDEIIVANPEEKGGTITFRKGDVIDPKVFKSPEEVKSMMDLGAIKPAAGDPFAGLAPLSKDAQDLRDAHDELLERMQTLEKRLAVAEAERDEARRHAGKLEEILTAPTPAG